MQEIVLLKPFGRFKKGDKIEANEMRANYFIRMGVAEKYVKPKAKPKKEKENDKPRTTRKSKAKS